MQNSPTPINLIRKKETAFIDKFINWTLSIGRLIVIITEIIAISAFLYRFSLDEKLVALHDEIEQKQKQLSLFQKDEKNFRNFQDRLSLVSKFSEQSTMTFKTFQDIVGFTPEELKFNELTLKNDQTTIDLNVASIPSLTQFINSLKSYPNTKSVSVDNIENNPGAGLTVAITALFK